MVPKFATRSPTLRKRKSRGSLMCDTRIINCIKAANLSSSKPKPTQPWHFDSLGILAMLSVWEKTLQYILH